MSEPARSRPAHLQLLAVSWNFGWPVAAGVALGHWLDERLGTSPAATLVLGIGAMAAAAWRLVSLSKQDVAERQEAEVGERRAQAEEQQARAAERKAQARQEVADDEEVGR